METHILLKDVITWLIMAFGFGGIMISQKIWISQLQIAVFDTSGSPRLVSYSAMDRKMSECLSSNLDRFQRVEKEFESILIRVKRIEDDSTIRQVTDANKWAEIISCLSHISEKIDISCRGLK